jgi:uncharacterized membrane protein YdbT with pleckstrin-like domain
MYLIKENAALPHDVAMKLTPEEQRGPTILVRMHPAVIAWPVAKGVLLLILAVSIAAIVKGTAALAVLLIAWAVFPGRKMALAFAAWAVDYFVVVKGRVVLITGLFDRKTAMMPIAKVTDMTYEQPVLGRLLGYGTFVIESAGQDQALREVSFIPRPNQVYMQIVKLIDPSGGADGD